MNKNKSIVKIIMIVLGAFFIGCFLMCLGIGGLFLNDTSTDKTYTQNRIETKTKLSKSKTKTNRSTNVKKTATETTQKTKKPTIKPTIKPTKISKQNVFNTQLKILKESFKGVAEIKVKNNNKVIEIIPYDKTFMIEAQMAYSGDLEKLETWNKLVDTLKQTSKNFNDKDLILSLVNNLNTENYILMINNGIVLYNFVEDMEDK